MIIHAFHSEFPPFWILHEFELLTRSDFGKLLQCHKGHIIEYKSIKIPFVAIFLRLGVFLAYID